MSRSRPERPVDSHERALAEGSPAATKELVLAGEGATRGQGLITSVCALAGVVAAVGTFLPWAEATLSDRGAVLFSVERTGVELSWNGSIVLGLGVVCGLAAVLSLETARARALMGVMAPAGLAIAILAAFEVDSADPLAAKLLRLRIGTFQTDNPVARAEIGTGLGLSFAAGAILFACGAGWFALGGFRRARGGAEP